MCIGDGHEDNGSSSVKSKSDSGISGSDVTCDTLSQVDDRSSNQ